MDDARAARDGAPNRGEIADVGPSVFGGRLQIEPGGRKRLSDFLLFEAAYAELFFTETLWPDVTEETLDEAISAFSRRQRRFG